MGSWNFCVFFLIWQEQIQKLPPFLLILLQIFDEQGRGVFIPHNFSYLHLDLISFRCTTFAPISFSPYN